MSTDNKIKIIKWDHIKLKSLCTAKKMINTKERQKCGMRENNKTISDKGLISKMYKELNSRKQSDLKMGREIEYTYFQKYTQMANW